MTSLHDLVHQNPQQKALEATKVIIILSFNLDQVQKTIDLLVCNIV